jgi:protein-tyrosine phosphatase
MLEKSISLQGVGNARQLGGYRIGDKRIRDGILIRTAALNQATPEALEALQNKYRVQTVIDLRMSQEQNHIPDPAIPGAMNIHLPVIEMEDMLTDVDPKLIEQFSDPQMDRMVMFNMAYETGMLNEKLYTDFLLKDRGRVAYRGFFEALLDLQEGRAILWHCTDGKDRTGCAAMLVLLALGADRETVMHDYMLTNGYNARLLEGIRQKVAPLGMPDEKLNALLFMSGGVAETYMDNAINALIREFGSVRGYLRELGVGEREISEIRGRLLTEVFPA